MSSSKKHTSENWLLVEWNSGGRDVVYVKSVVNPENQELNTGDVLTVIRRGEQEAATLIARAPERDMLKSQLKTEEGPGPSQLTTPVEDEVDYSSSASSWVPSNDEASQSDDSVTESQSKKIKLEHYKRQYTRKTSSKRILTPSNKANAVLNTMMKRERSLNETKNIGTQSMNNTILDSNTKNPNGFEKVTVEVQILKNIRKTFNLMFKMIDRLKQPIETNEDANDVPDTINTEESLNQLCTQMSEIMDEDRENLDVLNDNKENDVDVSENDEFNRSDDNVLISNKHSNVNVNNTQTDADKEWVPIGSGKTLIHQDQFRKVNWKSYTVATRTLLLAAFPRKILATHSLTGKRSPAFQNKPAKMCLDPKITTDVIIEIMDRFNVRENLVRSIITTKCADESKMLRTRNEKKVVVKKQKTED